MTKDNTGSNKYSRPHDGMVGTGFGEGTGTDQKMEGSKQKPDRGSSNQTGGLKNPALKGTNPRTRP